MTHFSPTTPINLPSVGEISQGGPTGRDSQHPRHPSTHIHILDDDSLLNIFSLCRPVILDENKASDTQIVEGGNWSRERWWYKLVKVCRRWRYLMLDSASYLRLSLVCARGTPVATMLAHSPPLPLIIDYLDHYSYATAKDEEGIVLALQHRDRLRRIRLLKAVPILQRLIKVLDGEYPILEHLYITDQRYLRPMIKRNTELNFPENFRAPQIRCLVLMNFAIPIGSPLLTTMGNLVTLDLSMIPRSVYFRPNALLQRLALMPQLEILGIFYDSDKPIRDMESQLLHTTITTRITLPNLRRFGFQGANAYLEALLPWITMPLLERLQVYFFNQPTYSIPYLQQSMDTTGNLRLKYARLTFYDDHVGVIVYPHKEAEMYTLDISLIGRNFDWQVDSTAQVCRTLRTVLFEVEHLVLDYERHNITLWWSAVAHRIHWRELLRTFGNVKTLYLRLWLVEQLARALEPGEDESSTELLPELQELSYLAVPGTNASYGAFAGFIDERQKAGRPVTVVRR
ncbi:hypothetical protein F5888DRAFT_1722325 [Russula emetica]|nr:hypothetical protein F5888DRAFT_1722325 [Russula emetica]